jgi:hypothetical protein
VRQAIRVQSVADYNEGNCRVCGERIKLNAIIEREYDGHRHVSIVHWDCGDKEKP